LKNIHLVAAWLPKLEQAVHSLNPAAGFRLWLTTEASEKFPRGLLESCLVRSSAVTAFGRQFMQDSNPERTV
jgi:DNA-binding transcriptional MocR family regulator